MARAAAAAAAAAPFGAREKRCTAQQSLVVASKVLVFLISLLKSSKNKSTNKMCSCFGSLSIRTQLIIGGVANEIQF